MRRVKFAASSSSYPYSKLSPVNPRDNVASQAESPTLQCCQSRPTIYYHQPNDSKSGYTLYDEPKAASSAFFLPASTSERQICTSLSFAEKKNKKNHAKLPINKCLPNNNRKTNSIKWNKARENNTPFSGWGFPTPHTH